MLKQSKVDSFPLFVTIDPTVKVCACCGKRRLKRTLKIDSPNIDQINLGVTCAGKWFKVNLSGNPFYAATRLQLHLRKLDDDTLEDILQGISEAE